MSLRLQSWAKGLSPRSKAIARDMNENGIAFQRGLIFELYCIGLLSSSSSSGKNLKSKKRETGTVTSKPMDGGSCRGTSVSRIALERSAIKTSPALSNAIDDAAVHFWAKRGFCRIPANLGLTMGGVRSGELLLFPS